MLIVNISRGIEAVKEGIECPSCCLVIHHMGSRFKFQRKILHKEALYIREVVISVSASNSTEGPLSNNTNIQLTVKIIFQNDFFQSD